MLEETCTRNNKVLESLGKSKSLQLSVEGKLNIHHFLLPRLLPLNFR